MGESYVQHYLYKCNAITDQKSNRKASINYASEWNSLIIHYRVDKV